MQGGCDNFMMPSATLVPSLQDSEGCFDGSFCSSHHVLTLRSKKGEGKKQAHFLLGNFQEFPHNTSFASHWSEPQLAERNTYSFFLAAACQVKILAVFRRKR